MASQPVRGPSAADLWSERLIRVFVNYRLTSIDQVFRRNRLTATEVCSMLRMMELTELVGNCPREHIKLIPYIDNGPLHFLFYFKQGPLNDRLLFNKL